MNAPLLGAAAAAMALAGGYLLYSSAAQAGGKVARPSLQRRFEAWAIQSGLGEVRPAELGSAIVAMSVVGGLAGYALFGGALPALACGIAFAAAPLSSYRSRRKARLAGAAEAWPRLLEELRLLIASTGRSVPQALFEVGRHAPAEWRDAFAAAEREWLLTTDFERTAAILKHQLADPTADVVCETLSVAHRLGGSDVDGRLADLIEDRVLDLQGRKDAASRQAGVRFARRFVLLVPFGMALAGLSIGTGRSAYESAGGQVAVLVGIASVVACWAWSGRLMGLPESPRVFR